MATGTQQEVSRDQLLNELKAISSDVQQIKKNLADIGSEVRIVHEEVKALPSGARWVSQEPQ